MCWDGKYMSADKKPKKRKTDLTISGVVVQKPFARGTKSEHEAIYIHCGDHEYVLRRINGNPFFDEILHSYKGKEVTVRGVLANNTFLAKDIKVRLSGETE